MDVATSAAQAVDEIERALRTYMSLPELIDLRLHPEGIQLQTSDFPKLIKESSGLDLRQYFVDAFREAPFLSAGEKTNLAKDVFRVFETVQAFVSDVKAGAIMKRGEQTVVPLPAAMTQGFVQKMVVDPQVKFRLQPDSPEEATFVDVSGITFHVGGKVLALKELKLKAADGLCTVTPILDEHASIPQDGPVLERLKTAGKDLLVGVLMRARQISIQLPVVMAEFRDYLSNAIRFRELLHDKDKDLVMFFEKTAKIAIEDPLTRALLARGNRVLKTGEAIELQRTGETVCDLGGVSLRIAPQLKLAMSRTLEQLKIDRLTGIGIEVPFESPAELGAIGLDLHRSIPKEITSLSLSAPSQKQTRRLVAGTAPGCWVGLDLGGNMQPALDPAGNWMVFGVTHNPISGIPQKFFLRLDQKNNLNMTAREITEVVTQTAIEGFDPSDPFTWKWAAVAIGGQTLLAAGDIVRDAVDADRIKDNARKLGRIIGRLLSDL